MCEHVSKITHDFPWDVIIYPYPNLNGGYLHRR